MTVRLIPVHEASTVVRVDLHVHGAATVAQFSARDQLGSALAVFPPAGDLLAPARGEAYGEGELSWLETGETT